MQVVEARPRFKFFDEIGNEFTIYSDNTTDHPNALVIYEVAQAVETVDDQNFVTGLFTLHPVS